MPTDTRSKLDEGYLLDHDREALATSALNATPDAILKMPGDSYAPFLPGLFSTFLFASMIVHAWWLAGAVLVGCVASLIGWMWPRRKLGQREPHRTIPEGGAIG